MINFAENLNKMIVAGLGGETEAPRTEVAVGHRLQYLDASGPVASFETNIVAPLRKLLVNMLPIQAGSGDPSPENIRPISGFESVSVIRTGISIWDEVWEVGSISNTTGLNANATDRIRSVNYVAVKPGTQYFVSGPHTVGLRFYDSDRNYLGYSTKLNASFITAENCYYIRFIILTSEYSYDTSINYPSSDHDYHPGNVQTVNITLGDTVYGGTLNVSTGRMTVTHVMNTVSEFAWSETDTPNIFRTNTTDKAIRTADLISSVYKTVEPTIVLANMPDLSIKANASNSYRRYVYVKDTRYSTVEEFAAAQASTQIAYELYTPLYLDVEPQQITTLIGENNVWSDAGDVNVTYTYYEETEGY